MVKQTKKEKKKTKRKISHAVLTFIYYLTISFNLVIHILYYDTENF